MNERREILNLLRANVGTIEENLSEFLIRNAEDMQAIGVPDEKLAQALITVAGSFAATTFGAAVASSAFRKAADAIDKTAEQFTARRN